MEVDWKESIGEMSAEAVIAWLESLDENKVIKLQKKILYDKEARPNCKLQQVTLLKWIAQNKVSSQEVKAFATIAASHKAMEALNDAEIDLLLPQVDGIIKFSSGFPNGKIIRENGVHVKFSAYSVAWHMAIFKGDRESFFRYGESAVQDFERIDRTQLGKPFFQTCTNVVRCAAVAALHGASLNELSRVQRAISAIKRAGSIGLEEAYSQSVIFKEYSVVLRALEACLLLEKKVSEGHEVASIFETQRTIFDIVLRKHEAKKVAIMKQNFEIVCEM